MKKIINILLIEDDTLDQMEVQRTLQKKDILFKLKIAKNGEEAFILLSEKVSDLFIGKPDIIILDLNMPKMNGFEFLKQIKGDEHLKDIKVFVLTTSEENEDKTKAIGLGAAGFLTKPLKLESPSTIDAFNLMIDLMNM
jgi:CheY-like chemotaxis protein